MEAGNQNWRSEQVGVAGYDLTVVRGGRGKPLLVLHDELGYPGWLKWNAALAEKRELVIPMHPGYGVSPAPEWIRTIRDLAGFYSIFVREQKLAPLDVIGFSLGGWIAAEMAAANPNQFAHMVLVAPAGIKPSEGEITDFFQIMAPDQLRATVRDPEATPEFAELFGGLSPQAFSLMEEARAQTARLAWQPFMHNPSLGHLLGVADSLPTLLVWGKEDGIVPISAARDYQRAIKNSKLVVFDKCGHRPEVEMLDRFVAETQKFLG
ncbi:MAG TPA: alpha/beta hydrolase [Candidatus Binataceae bacterium]|nr:alpha/beta hydrolase [Candidatus Binataceae bacterium]